MKYAIKEIFRTVQGEGYHAGTPATFVRFAGCNMWSGLDSSRERDAVRNEAECPRWCDTDFVGGRKMTAAEIVQECIDLAPGKDPYGLVVLTGGEPLLQVDDELIDRFKGWASPALTPARTIAIETNGTLAPKFAMHYTPSMSDRVWITCSPKRPRERTELRYAHELKLVWPAYQPGDWEDFPAIVRYLQPQALPGQRNEHVEHECAELVAQNDEWRLSLQTHKIVRIR